MINRRAVEASREAASTAIGEREEGGGVMMAERMVPLIILSFEL